MDNRYPTDEELQKIEQWDYSNFEELTLFIQSIWNWGEDYARLGPWKEDDHKTNYREFVLITGGWSGNEDILVALHNNKMFQMMCWYSSHRGGLHIYHIKNIKV